MEAQSIGKDAIREAVAARKSEGYRFVTMTCVELDEDSCDLLYHFDKDLELVSLRATVAKNETVPSVSDIFFAAFLVENEIQDQFGLTFEGLVLNFHRSLYLDEEITTLPFCKYSVSQKQQP